MEELTTSLLDLLYELEGRGVPIMVAGGFGLHLQRRHLAATGQRTLFDELPEPRATNDLDLFLRADVVADLGRCKEVAEAILRLGYTVVEEAKFLQWKREVLVAEVPQEVNIDVLVGPLGKYRKQVHVKSPRVRPRGDIQFHAHAVEEAVHIEEAPIAVTVAGKRSTGQPYAGTVHIPQAFPYLMMKLHAFDDRKDDATQDLARHHALDLYTIVGMMTEAEYERARELGALHASDEHVRTSRRIVRACFRESSAMGTIRLREHKGFRADFRLQDFMDVLGEVFEDRPV